MISPIAGSMALPNNAMYRTFHAVTKSQAKCIEPPLGALPRFQWPFQIAQTTLVKKKKASGYLLFVWVKV
jgi:hypothetical protein